jgi:molybdopterin-guanine dinucleotide biosynthesis protein A
MGEPLDGIVLAGGQSRRLGLDKAGLVFGGRPLLEIVVERLAGVCQDVVVACGRIDQEGRPALPVRQVSDSIPGRGPLAGLQAGLSAVRSEFALVMACDMPFLSPGLLTYMAGLPRRFEALSPLVDGRWHPLHAIYARSCLPAIEQLLAEGRNSVEELLSRLRVQALTEDELHRHDPEGLSLFNLNGPRDLKRARALWKRLERRTIGPAAAAR